MKDVMEFDVNDKNGLDAVVSIVKEKYRRQGRVKVAVDKKSSKDCENCWEFMKCPEKIQKNCSSHTMGYQVECWLLMDMEKGGHANNNGGCLNCAWFKKNNPALFDMIRNMI